MPGIAVSVEVLDGLAYVSGGEWGMSVVDVSVPSDPVELGVIDTEGWASDSAVAPINGAPVAVVADSLWRLDVVDADDPQELEIVSEVRLWDGTFSVEAIDGFAYAINRNGTQLSIVDISTPSDAELVGDLFLGESYEPAGLAVEGGFVYVAGKALYVVDVSDPASPVTVSQVEGSIPGHDAAVSHGNVAVAAGETIRFFDATNPYEPIEGESWQVGDFPGQAGGVTSTERHVVGFSRKTIRHHRPADPNPGLRIFDVNDPVRPATIGSFLDNDFIGDAEGAGDLVFVVTQNRFFHSHFRVVDLTDASRPQEIGTVPLPVYWNFSDTSFVDLDVDGDLAVVVGSKGLVAIDIADPTQPVVLGEISDPFTHVELVGDRAFVVEETTIRLVDLTDPSDPRLVNGGLHWFELNGGVSDFEIADGHAFIVVRTDLGDELISVIDVETEVGWTEIGAVPLDDGSTLDGGLSVADGQAVLARTDGDTPRGILVVYDVSDPAEPVFKAETVLPGLEHAVLLNDNKIYVTDSRAGLAVFDGWPCRSGSAEPPGGFISATE
jgi:hypothetical protein